MWARLRHLTIDEARVRSKQRFWRTAERLLGNSKVRNDALELTSFCWGKNGPIAEPGEPRRRCEFLESADVAWLPGIHNVAAQLRSGNAPVLGYGYLPIGDPPDWHRDPVSKLRADRVHWSRIDTLNTAIVGDHKALWEPNRHQYLLALAYAWLLQQDAADFALIERHLDSWLADNPVKIGVNWASSIELAYRIICWIWLLTLLRQAPWNTDLHHRLLQSIEAQALHVERYLSTYYSPNTHLTGEALALFYVGTLLRNSRHAARLRRVGATILETCIDRQIYADGIYFEQATQYQRYTVEIYLHFLTLARNSDWPVSGKMGSAIERQLEVLRSISDSAGRMPLIGDDDGGWLLPFDFTAPDDVSGVLNAGAMLFGRPELRSTRSNQALSVWLFGIDATESIKIAPQSTPNWTNRYFSDGGLVVLRDGWDDRSCILTFDVGPHGTLNCGHAHADALSLTLNLGNRPYLIDRGTLTYCGPERNEYRSTGSHNTLEFDATSSAEPAAPFQWQSIPNRPQSVWRQSDRASIFAGYSEGHRTTAQRSRHLRVVVHPKNGAFLVLDRGRRMSNSQIIGRWQFAPDIAVTKFAAHFQADSAVGPGAPLGDIALPFAASARILSRDVSPRYGARLPAQCIEAVADANGCLMALFAFGRLQQHAVANAIEYRWHDNAGFNRVSIPNDPEKRMPIVWSIFQPQDPANDRGPGIPDCVFTIDSSLTSANSLIDQNLDLVDIENRVRVAGPGDTVWHSIPTFVPTEK